MLPEPISRISHYRVAVFSFAYAPVEGGAEVAIREIMHRLTQKYAFEVFTHRFLESHPESQMHSQGAIRRLGPGGKAIAASYGLSVAKLIYIWRAWRAAERAHREEPFTVIWAVMAAYAGAAALLFKLNHPTIPLVLTLQEGDTERHIIRRVNILYPLWRLLFRKADVVQAISLYLADLARRHGARKTIEVVPNGVNVQKQKVRIGKRALADGPVRIITTSRLVPKNGIDVLIRAMALLKVRVTATLTIVGDGPERDVLESLAQSLGIASIVTFIGQVDADQIPRYLMQADIFARPSRSEGLGNSFLEAMAVGLPVIGTPVGGIPEFLRDGETGLMARVDDPADLARKLLALATNQIVRQSLAKAGQRLVEEKYQWDHIAQRMGQLFSTLALRRSVVIASGLFPPDIGGSATWSAFMSRELPRMGIDVTVVTYGPRRKLPGVHTMSRIVPKGIRHVAYLIVLTFAARHANAIIAADPSFGAGFMALIASVLTGKPLIVRVTGDYAWEQGRQRFGVTDGIDEFQKKKYGIAVSVLRWCQSIVVRKATLVVAPSQYLCRLAIGWGASRQQTTLIYNAIDPLPSVGKVLARERLGVKGFLLVSSGRLVPWKGFDELIVAAADLGKRFQNLTLVIVGDGPERQKLAEQAKVLGIGNRVVFTGVLSRERLGMYLAAADVFCLNSSYEGLSHQLIEVLCGFDLAVIAADAGGNPELARRFGERMTLVPVGDREALARALTYALSHRAVPVRRIRTCEPFSEGAVVEQWRKKVIELTDIV